MLSESKLYKYLNCLLKGDAKNKIKKYFDFKPIQNEKDYQESIKDPNFKKYSKIAFNAKILFPTTLKINDELKEDFSGEFYLLWWFNNEKCKSEIILNKPIPDSPDNTDKPKLGIMQQLSHFYKRNLGPTPEVPIKLGDNIDKLFDGLNDTEIYKKSCEIFLKENLLKYYTDIYVCAKEFYQPLTDPLSQFKFKYLNELKEEIEKKYVLNAKPILALLNTLYKLISFPGDFKNYEALKEYFNSEYKRYYAILNADSEKSGQKFTEGTRKYINTMMKIINGKTVGDITGTGQESIQDPDVMDLGKILISPGELEMPSLPENYQTIRNA